MVWSGHDERRPDLCAELHMTRKGANQDGGADRCPVPWGSVMAFCDGQGGPVASGSANGSTGWFADEEAEDLAEFVWFQSGIMWQRAPQDRRRRTGDFIPCLDAATRHLRHLHRKRARLAGASASLSGGWRSVASCAGSWSRRRRGGSWSGSLRRVALYDPVSAQPVAQHPHSFDANLAALLVRDAL